MTYPPAHSTATGGQPLRVSAPLVIAFHAFLPAWHVMTCLMSHVMARNPSWLMLLGEREGRKPISSGTRPAGGGTRGINTQ